MAEDTGWGDIEVELTWVQDLDKLIRERTKSHLSSVDVAGHTTDWYLAGLTIEEAFHKWIELHYI